MVKRAPYKRLILGSNPSGTTGFVPRRRSVKPLADNRWGAERFNSSRTHQFLLIDLRRPHGFAGEHPYKISQLSRSI